MNLPFQTKIARFFPLSLIVVCLLCASAIQPARGENIQQMMSANEFAAAGLNKLSKKELSNLDAWLQGYRQTTVKQATAAVKVAKQDVILSHVDGQFGGAAGGMIIKLEDGTAWKVANSGDHFSGSGDRPAVVVYRTFFGFKMRVEGTPDFYVDQVRDR